MGLFYFMVEIKFICETSNNFLSLETFDDYVEIAIDTGKDIYAVHLTTKDSEQLIDELRKIIHKIKWK